MVCFIAVSFPGDKASHQQLDLPVRRQELKRQKAKEAKGGKRQKRQKAKGGKRGRGKNSPGQKHWLHPAQKAQQQKVSCLPPQLRLPMISRPQHCHRLPPSLQTLTHSSHSPVDSLARLSLVH